MRILLIFSLFAFLGLTAYGKYDHEIFDLVSELEAGEGKGTTFYSFLGVESTATIPDIGKAYRKKSNPDKNPGVKGAHERFSRLGVISTILRNEESRKRYDFFYKNGVPKWRGTGYYYARFRPGLGTVLTFLIFLTSGLQYIIQRMNYKNDLARIQQFVSKARLAAWGPKLNRVEGRRKVKVNVGGGSHVADDGEEYTSGGKWIEMVVEGDHVYILEPHGELLPLDNSAASPPAIGRTWFLALAKSLYSYIRRYPNASSSSETQESEDTDMDETDSASEAKRSKGATMAGGRRRKPVKRR
ncbi:hypothetical protein JB92DRAFT_3082520 [Gautieria morchelliformis]|nr:hypothetical protein JB92DRAFT_3082520 [Gautieria morchelliformis]